MWQNMALVALGGAIGTLCRYGLSSAVMHYASHDFPWGTFAVNALGCLLFGVAASAADTQFELTPAARLLLLTGFMGAFTTFSTFAFDTAELGKDGQWLPMALNLVGQNTAGVLLVLAGLVVGRQIWAG